MRAEVVVLHRAAPMCVDHRRPLLARPDAVSPMILIGETAAWPAQHGNVELFQCCHDIVADAARIRDRGLFADPDSLVNAASEMFGKLSVNIAIDDAFRVIDLDDELVHSVVLLMDSYPAVVRRTLFLSQRNGH